MKITLLYFAAVRDLVGCDEEQVELPSNVFTVGDLSAYLATLHQTLSGRLIAVRFAVNEEFATARQTLADGDTVALIPPVAGG